MNIFGASLTPDGNLSTTCAIGNVLSLQGFFNAGAGFYRKLPNLAKKRIANREFIREGYPAGVQKSPSTLVNLAGFQIRLHSAILKDRERRR
jgi:hypothetical protein